MINYITGANGFVGSHLVKALEDVTPLEDIVCIPHSEIMDTKLQPFDNLYFLSTYGNMYLHTDERKIMQANIDDLCHLLDDARRYKFKSFIYMSSSSVELPVQTRYSETKKIAEEILLPFIENYNLPICIIRPYSITGVGEQKEHLIPTLIRSCFTGELVNFVPEPKHDYIDVNDVVSEILQLSASCSKGIFRLGNSFGVSNAEVLKLVESATASKGGRKANINIVDNLRPYDSKDWFAKDYISREHWTQRRPLNDTIKAMVNDYAGT